VFGSAIAPQVAILAITAGVTVSIMTWLVMPGVTRLLHGWLQPEAPADTTAHEVPRACRPRWRLGS
jgi:antibiotic biosynthesis monooxygenase (ABM) superfamily enzyme